MNKYHKQFIISNLKLNLSNYFNFSKNEFGEDQKELNKSDPKFVEIKDIVNGCKVHQDDNDHRFYLSDLFLVDDDHYIAEIHGGDNGSGSWLDYLVELKNLFESLESRYGSDNSRGAWMIDIKNDCLDDVYTARIGIRKIK